MMNESVKRHQALKFSKSLNKALPELLRACGRIQSTWPALQESYTRPCYVEPDRCSRVRP